MSNFLVMISVHNTRMLRLAAIIACLAIWGSLSGAQARPPVPASIPAPSALCRAAILQAERMGRIPDRLMDAIAMVESGRRDPVSGAVYPWPWTINAEGVGHWYDSKAEAIQAVEALQARGVRSIDVGCMQVNLMHHPDAFASLDQAFDPVTNANFGARFLRELFEQTYAWPLAAAAYHSFTPDLGAEYARKVLAAWGVPQAPSGAQMVTQGAPAMPPAPGGRVAVMMPIGTESIRVMPLPGRQAGIPGGPTVTGRGLDAYRAAPVAMALRMPRAG
jgi:Transglycosylase SLT domain